MYHIFSLDQVLECVSVGPLLRVGRTVSDGGEVSQTETVLHALLTTRLLLLSALFTKTSEIMQIYVGSAIVTETNKIFW